MGTRGGREDGGELGEECVGLLQDRRNPVNIIGIVAQEKMSRRSGLNEFTANCIVA